MKRITIPEPVRFTRGKPDPATGQPITYTAQQFLREFVWTSPRWVKHEDDHKALRRLFPQLDDAAATPGATVDITAGDHERMLPMFRCEDLQLNPEVAFEVREIAYPFIWPEDVKEEPATKDHQP
jgi:hypothetical protein